MVKPFEVVSAESRLRMLTCSARLQVYRSSELLLLAHQFANNQIDQLSGTGGTIMVPIKRHVKGDVDPCTYLVASHEEEERCSPTCYWPHLRIAT